jgi:NAD(P)-dependent dehydrogenase (short-subunit alcohol dehydrogenase family)
MNLTNNPLTSAVLVQRPRSSADEIAAAAGGKVILVTGASHGIGEALVQRLARAGATVLLVARSADRLEDHAARLTGEGHRAYAYPTDLGDEAAVDALVERVIAEHGRVDVLVNNAGKSIRRSIALSYDRFHDFQRTAAANYLGPVQLTVGLLRHMRARREGHIVNTSTVGVLLPPAPRWSAYQASKAAFDVWCKAVAPEIAADGIAMSTVYMNLVHTRMSAPTPAWREQPGLTADEAAGLLCDAIVRRPRRIAIWWAGPLHLLTIAAEGFTQRLFGAIYRRGVDSPSAQGAGPPSAQRDRQAAAPTARRGP